MGKKFAQTRPDKWAQAAAQASTPSIHAWKIGLIRITLAEAKNMKSSREKSGTGCVRRESHACVKAEEKFKEILKNVIH